jgi:catechol 2,3-dioxygenase-like lactoylglutathione lyase family enzyme
MELTTIQARRLGHVTLSTPDLPRLVDYYTHIIGLTLVDRTESRAVLASRLGQEAVVLERGDRHQCTALSLQVAPRLDLAEIAAQLSKLGISSDQCPDITPGISRAVRFDDPKGTHIELFSEYANAPEDPQEAAIMPFKLGHVAFTTTDVQRVVEFYRTVLGFRISDWRGDFFAFLRCGPDHHSVNFVGGGADKIHHAAFELRDWSEIQRACDFLAKRSIRLVIGPIRHIIGHNIAIYHKDPDEMLVEFFTELDQMKDEELGFFDPRPWHQDRPQVPKVWGPDTLTNYWGPGRLVTRDE